MYVVRLRRRFWLFVRHIWCRIFVHTISVYRLVFPVVIVRRIVFYLHIQVCMRRGSFSLDLGMAPFYYCMYVVLVVPYFRAILRLRVTELTRPGMCD